MAQNKNTPTKASTAPKKKGANTKQAAKEKSAGKRKSSAKKTTRAKSTQNAASSLTNFNYEVGTIAATLMSERVSALQKTGKPTDVSDPSWDSEFAGAIKRAELILRKLSIRDFDVHAYQVFPEGAKFTEEQILNEFKRVGWKNLKSKRPTMDLMADLRESFEIYLDEIGDRLPPSSASTAQKASDALRRGFKAIWRSSEAIRAVYPNFEDATTGFLEQLNEEIFTRSRSEVFGEIDFWHSLFDWCFPFEDRGESQIRRYRPHELFRLAAMREWQKDKLVLTLSDLSPEFVPYPPKNLEWERDFEIFSKSGWDTPE